MYGIIITKFQWNLSIYLYTHKTVERVSKIKEESRKLYTGL